MKENLKNVLKKKKIWDWIVWIQGLQNKEFVTMSLK